MSCRKMNNFTFFTLLNVSISLQRPFVLGVTIYLMSTRGVICLLFLLLKDRNHVTFLLSLSTCCRFQVYKCTVKEHEQSGELFLTIKRYYGLDILSTLRRYLTSDIDVSLLKLFHFSDIDGVNF